MKPLALCLLLSGCCCSIPSSDTAEWDQAVKRETANPQIYALHPGTANVWEIEVAYPEGWTQADEDEAMERAAQRGVRALQDQLTARGVDPGPLQVLPPPPLPRGLRTAWTARFVTLFPEVPMLAAEGQMSSLKCRECVASANRSHASYVINFGVTPVDLRTTTREALQAGVKITERGWFQSMGDENGATFAIPVEGAATLRLVESCPVTLARVQMKVKVGAYSGIAEVPKMQEATWYEARDAKCVQSAATVRTEVGPSFKTNSPPSARRLMELGAQLRR